MSDQYGQGQGGPPGYGSQPGDGQSYGSAPQYGSGSQAYGSAPQDRPYGHPVNAPHGQYASAPQGYSDAPFAHGSAPMPEPERSRGRGWIVGAVLLLTAVASFALVTILMHKKSNNHDAMAPAPSTVATSPSVVAPSTSGSPSSSSPSGSMSSPVDFPAEASMRCSVRNDAGGLDLVENTIADKARTSENGKTSCAFLEVVRDAVIAHQVDQKGETSYSMNPYSPVVKHNVSLNCSLEGAFTYCSGGDHAEIWVRNP